MALSICSFPAPPSTGWERQQAWVWTCGKELPRGWGASRAGGWGEGLLQQPHLFMDLQRRRRLWGYGTWNQGRGHRTGVYQKYLPTLGALGAQGTQGTWGNSNCRVPKGIQGARVVIVPVVRGGKQTSYTLTDCTRKQHNQQNNPKPKVLSAHQVLSLSVVPLVPRVPGKRGTHCARNPYIRVYTHNPNQ